jgi:hypothetical protein
MLLEIEKILKRLEVQTKEKKAQKNRINHIFCSLFPHSKFNWWDNSTPYIYNNYMHTKE